MSRRTTAAVLASAAVTALAAVSLTQHFVAAAAGGANQAEPRSAAASPDGTSSTRTASAVRLAARPNIVLITTDDQRVDEMAWMPRTRRLLGKAGVTFTDALSPHPLCCPARAEILTGQYAQNNGVRSNRPEYLGGFGRLRADATIANWLHEAGYSTAFVGKFLNGYKARDGLLPGWDIFNPLTRRVYSYYGYTMRATGKTRYPHTHSADLIGNKTVQYIRRLSDRDQPFFIWASQVAPHGACAPSIETTCLLSPYPARRHAKLFPDATAPVLSDPSFNELDLSDKPDYVRSGQVIDPAMIDQLFRDRIRSLQAVDEATAKIITALKEAGELRNTVVVFTNDNGFMLGEHRRLMKSVPYEAALRVPMLARGPGIPAGLKRSQTVTLVDLAPTFLALAHARAGITVDGQNFLPALRRNRTGLRDTVLIQSGPELPEHLEAGWFYRGVRTSRYTYVRYPETGFVELYDRNTDPSELTNVASDPRYATVVATLAHRTDLLSVCSGASCRVRFGPVPSPLP